MGRVVFRNLPLQSGLFYQPDLGRKLRDLAPQADLGILQLVRLAVHLDDFGDTPLLVDLIDSLSLNFSLRAEVDQVWLRPLLKLEARLLAVGERKLADRAAGVIVVCERDRQALVNRLSPELAARVGVVRLSVRERKVEPPLQAESPGGGADPGDHRQPRLLRERRRRHLVAGRGLAGAAAGAAGHPGGGGGRPAGAAAAARAGKGRRRAADRIAARHALRDRPGHPVTRAHALRLGRADQGPGGLGRGRAGGGTPWAVAGTSGRQGEDFRLVGTHPIEWVHAIVELLDDPEARRRYAENGRRRLADDYSRETVRRQLLDVIDALGVPAAARHAGLAAGTAAVKS